jgi:hypothetical protein
MSSEVPIEIEDKRSQHHARTCRTKADLRSKISMTLHDGASMLIFDCHQVGATQSMTQNGLPPPSNAAISGAGI